MALLRSATQVWSAGLFARDCIARGTLLEASPCILIPAEQYQAHLRYGVAGGLQVQCGHVHDSFTACYAGSLPQSDALCQRQALHYRHTILEHYLFAGRMGSMLMCLGLGKHMGLWVHPLLKETGTRRC